MIFVFDDLRSMGTCIMLVTTKSTNFFQTFEKVGKLWSYEKITFAHDQDLIEFGRLKLRDLNAFLGAVKMLNGT